jgi:hypothetical protein
MALALLPPALLLIALLRSATLAARPVTAEAIKLNPRSEFSWRWLRRRRIYNGATMACQLFVFGWEVGLLRLPVNLSLVWNAYISLALAACCNLGSLILAFMVERRLNASERALRTG